MIKISYIQEYVTLAETLNFSKTAELCYITQPALSRHIAELEEDMGAKLLERNTRSVSLTPAGESVYSNFKEILKYYRGAQKSAANFSSGKAGSIRVYSPYYWTEQYTEPAVLTFSEVNPNCEIEIVSCQPTEGIHAVIDDKADIAVSYEARGISQSIRCVPYAEDRMAVFMTEHNPLAIRSSISVEELSSEKLIHVQGYSEFPVAVSENIGNFFRTYDSSHSEIIYSQQIDTIAMDIERHDGISIMPLGVSKMGRKYIKAVPLEGEESKIKICLYYKADNSNPLIPAFVNTTIRAFEKYRL